MTYSRQELIDNLKQNVCTVTFTKADGSERTMTCTLLETKLPKLDTNWVPKKKINENTISVWDLEKEEWRSFKISSIITFAKISGN